MSFKLPIDPDSITNFQEAKNAIELLLNLYMKQQEEIQLLKAEIARLKAIKAEHTAKQDYVQTLIDTQEALKARFEGTIDEIVIVIPSTIN